MNLGWARDLLEQRECRERDVVQVLSLVLRSLSCFLRLPVKENMIASLKIIILMQRMRPRPSSIMSVIPAQPRHVREAIFVPPSPAEVPAGCKCLSESDETICCRDKLSN